MSTTLALFDTAVTALMAALATPSGIVALCSAGVAGSLVLLHGALLPINIFRAAQMVRLTRRVRDAATTSDFSGVWLRPYMRRRRLRKDAILFRRGDAAKRLYFLAEGQIEFVEIGQTMEPGRLFGEIGFFAPDKRRTLTARCATNCVVLQMDEMTFKALYFQNPAFGFEVVTLVAGRLLADRRRLEEQLAAGSLSTPSAPSAAQPTAAPREQPIANQLSSD